MLYLRMPNGDMVSLFLTIKMLQQTSVEAENNFYDIQRLFSSNI